MSLLLLPVSGVAQATVRREPAPMLTTGLFIGTIEEGARIFTPDAAPDALTRFLGIADGSLRDARQMVWGLRAPALEDRDVVDALAAAGRETFALELSFEPEAVRLTIQDDGRGAVEPDGHWGIAGMRERARSAGGSLSLTGAPGAGVRVVLTVPLSRAE